MKKRRKLHIFSTCTNIKSFPASAECQLGRFEDQPVDQVVQQWWKNLNSKRFHQVEAEKLYVGSHWKETLATVTEGQQRGFDTQFWILSAGWGLLAADQKICPYAATFTAGADDSIHSLDWPEESSHKERCRSWWREINSLSSAEEPTSIVSLAQEARSTLLFILSVDYFLAIEQELLELTSKGHSVLIVSAGLYTEKGVAHPQLTDHILPFNDKFKQLEDYLNKTNVSLNARLANWLLREHSETMALGVKETVVRVAEIESSLPEMKRRPVVKMTDDEVLDFTGQHYVSQVSSASQLLKILRHQEQKSCEQKRFGQLFRQYQNENDRGLF